MNPTQITTNAKTKIDGAVSHLQDDLKKVRTGRAHPDMLEGISVEVYGARMPLNQAATITTPEPQLLQVTPFDPANVQAISEAIRNDQGLGFNPSDDGRIVRVPVPSLTEERRRQIVKQLGEKIESARISVRNVRQEAIKAIKQIKDAKEISEDDAKRLEKDVDVVVGASQDRLDEIAKAKEQEIMTI